MESRISVIKPKSDSDCGLSGSNAVGEVVEVSNSYRIWRGRGTDGWKRWNNQSGAAFGALAAGVDPDGPTLG
eukprot:5816082-Prymnesium_polylepis.2